MHFILRGGSVLGGSFPGAWGLKFVGMGRKGKRREGRWELGWEAVGQVLICDLKTIFP